MDKFTKFTLGFLSLQLFVMGLLVSHLCYKLGYEQGRSSVYRDWASDGTEGTNLVPPDYDGGKFKKGKHYVKAR